MERPTRTPGEYGPVPIRPVPFARGEARLPVPSTRLFGREDEVATVCHVLGSGDTRLVTLTGPGGVGKTRLAIEIAAAMAPAFADGARFVELAGVRNSELVWQEIARGAGDRLAAPGRSGDASVTVLREFDGLLVLDNFEHVASSAPVLSKLLETCPDLTLLVTSRTTLRLSAERVFSVPPLPVPVRILEGDIAALEQVAAVRLFADRARAQRHDFALTPANVAAVGAICDTVAGLPLSIVLAAAHVDLMTPADLLERFRHRLPLLDRGPRDAPDRHRSVESAIEWSYDLLDVRTRLAFRRLSVFVGGFTFHAAEAVLGESVALDAIGTLVNSSLLMVTTTPDEPTRYAMLEPIREYALERLAGEGEPSSHREPGDSEEVIAARHRHAAHFGDLAEWADWAWFMAPSEGEPRLAALEAETANFRAALAWLQQRGDHVALLRMAMSLGGLWVVLGHPREGARWLETGLREGRDIPAPVRARSLATMSWCVNTAGDPERALTLAETSLAIWRALDAPLYLAQALILCGVPAYRVEGRHRDAARWFEEGLDVLTAVDAPDWIPNMRGMFGIQLGHAALSRGDIDRAERHLDAVRADEAARGFAMGASYIYGSALPLELADTARARGDAAAALQLYRSVLPISLELHNLRGFCHALGGTAGALAVLGDHERAGRLFGACEALHERLGYEFNEVFDSERARGLPEPWMRASDSFGDAQRLYEAVRNRLPLPPISDPGAVADAWAEGRAMPLDVAIDLALDDRSRRASPGDAAAPAGLSSREVEVLQLLVEGKSDAEIADALFISRRTVATHVRHIYDKVGVSSRAQAAAWAVRNGIA